MALRGKARRIPVLRKGRVRKLGVQPAWMSWHPNGELMVLGNAGLLETVGGGREFRVPPRISEFTWAAGGGLLLGIAQGELLIFDGKTGEKRASATFADGIVEARWSPSGTRIAVGLDDGSIEIVDAMSGESLLWKHHDREVTGLDWRDHESLVATSRSGVVIYEVAETSIEELIGMRRGGQDGDLLGVRVVDGGEFVTLSEPGTLTHWNQQLEEIASYELPSADTAWLCAVAPTRQLVAVADSEGALRLVSLREQAITGELFLGNDYAAPAAVVGFSPDETTIALTDDEGERVVFARVATEIRAEESTQRYRNAKVVLVGESGVGKSGLALALMRRPFSATESTHARQVTTLDSQRITDGELDEVREVVLWDLAGQAGYRAFHRLSLRNVAVGVIVFDAASEVDPFRGVPYWARALDEVTGERSAEKVLALARVDRGSLRVSDARLEALKAKLGIAQHYETSARTGSGVDELRDALLATIDWNATPTVVASESFHRTRAKLLELKSSGRLICNFQQLLATVAGMRAGTDEANVLRQCLERLENVGVVVELSMRDEWLLQPELLDSYVAYLAQAARREPDGLGQISEQTALEGGYPHEEQPDAAAESAMLLTAVSEAVGRNLALRVPTETGQMLVFPSECRNDPLDEASLHNREMEYVFQGSVGSIYASLAVMLVNSLFFGEQSSYELFRNAALFHTGPGETAGLVADYPDRDDESFGRLTVFFSNDIRRADKLAFLRYVDYQLARLAQPGSLQRHRLYTCCETTVPSEVLQKRLALGKQTVVCGVCDRTVPMDDLAERAREIDKAVARKMQDGAHQQARQQRLAEAENLEAREFHHVMLCYNSMDAAAVERIRTALREQGVLAWDDSAVLGGDVHTRVIETKLREIESIAIIVGPTSLGRWQEEEYYAAVSEVVSAKSSGRRKRLLAVMLPGAPEIDSLPPFLRNRSVVDMRRTGVTEKAAADLARAVTA